MLGYTGQQQWGVRLRSPGARQRDRPGHRTVAIWGWLAEYPRLPWSRRPLELQMEDAPEFFYAGDTLRSTSRSGRMGQPGLYALHLFLSFRALCQYILTLVIICSAVIIIGWSAERVALSRLASDNDIIVGDRPNCSFRMQLNP